MINYDGRWNNGGHTKTIVLRTCDNQQVINSQRFHNERDFEEAQNFLMVEKDRWYNSDQFIGRQLEVVVI